MLRIGQRDSQLRGRVLSPWFFIAVVFVGLCRKQAAQAADPPPTQPLSAQERRTMENDLRLVEQQLAGLRDSQANSADAEIYAKGLAWALRFDREFTVADRQRLTKALTRGRERVEALSAGKHPWTERNGRVALGYVSKVDGSVQPYGVVIPHGYDPKQPIRLDVVLHGSSKPIGMSELKFIGRFDDAEDLPAPSQPFLELHPLGRVENCYRWAGESDVFEAIEDVCRRYAIDRRRIVLRGMSMGASGTWHLGLKHPGFFVALGPYCGYVDTHKFSETPGMNFVRVGPLPVHQELALHMLDSVDYAANASVVPAIACMGEKDPFFQAHVLMGEAMQREGLAMLNLISPGTGHKIDPVTHAEQMRRISEYVDRGLNSSPREIRFVTWTLKYPRCHWLEILGLEKHYSRADVVAKVEGNTIDFSKAQNITRLAINLAQAPEENKQVRIAGIELPLPAEASTKTVVLERNESSWRLYTDTSRPGSGKRPGLQGPIDDAFTTPFLCVRGTGTPWNSKIHQYTDAALDRFANEWRQYFRGELPIKLDSDVTAEDLRTRNLILFGDPGSNPWISKVLTGLPLRWTRESLVMNGQAYSAASHLPALIAPNPLPSVGERYVVLNTGHTFHATELGRLNYLLFPRWGDWAVLKAGGSSDPANLVDQVEAAGYFGEDWKFPGNSQH